MLWCLHNDKLGELLPYLKNGLVIENVSTDITDNLADFVEVKNALSMSNRLLAGDLSMLRGSNQSKRGRT